MKGGFYIAILLSSLFYYEISSEHVTVLHDGTNSKSRFSKTDVVKSIRADHEKHVNYKDVTSDIETQDDLSTSDNLFGNDDKIKIDEEIHTQTKNAFKAKDTNKETYANAEKPIEKYKSKDKAIDEETKTGNTNIFSTDNKVYELFPSKAAKDTFPNKKESNKEKRDRLPNEIQASDHGTGNVNDTNSSIYSNVNHYYCVTKKFKENQIILHGTKAWTFPVQDVNLTLAYPVAKPENKAQETTKVDFIITGFKVILYIDGSESRGYITDGGVLQSNIKMVFISKGITSLLYQFWLYGTPRGSIDVDSNSTKFLYVCN